MKALAVVAVLCGAAHAEPAVRATITHDVTERDARGVTRTTRYEERFERAGDNVWLERIAPEQPTAGELDLELAARWWTRAADGAARVVLASTPQRTLVELTPNEARDRGIADRWLLAAALVDRTGFTAGAAERGGRWFERSTRGEVVRVLWSEALAIPLVVEVKSRDGRFVSRTVVEAVAGAGTQPWARAQRYHRIELSDLED